MANSTGKTIGLVFLILLIPLMLLFSPMLFLMPFRVFSQVFRGVHLINPALHLGPQEFWIFSGASLMPIALLILWIIVVIWVYRDAEQRGMNGVLWALLVFVGNLVGLLIFLIIRNDNAAVRLDSENAKPCPKCGKPVQQRFSFCAHCGARLQAVCPNCKEPVKNDWRVCPHCGEKLPAT